MLNETHDPDNLRLICSYPTTPVAGGVVIYGDLCGIAEGDEDTVTGETVVKLGPWIGDLSVTDINTGGIAKGAPLFASKATPVVLSNDSTGVFFGWANEIVTTGATATIEVIKDAYAGGVIAAGAIGATQLAAQAVTEAKVQVGAASAGLSGLVTKFVAPGNVIGGIPVVHHILMVAGANGDTNITLTHKTRITDVIVHPRTTVESAAVTVKSTTNAITDAIVAATAGAVTRAGSIAVAYDTIAAGGVLRATGSGGATQPDCDVYVYGFRVA
jgi:hypothetical protein